MADIASFDFKDVRRGVMRGDVALAAIVLGVLAILLTPLPAMVMDMLLALSQD